jgi:hypothetical protein
VLLGAALAVVLYFSYIFFLVPLPFVYLRLRRGRRVFFFSALLSFVVVAAIYLIGIDTLGAVPEKIPNLRLLVTVPYLGSISLDTKLAILAFGIGNFIVYLVVSRIITAILERPQSSFRLAFFTVMGITLVAMTAAGVLILPNTDEIILASKDIVLQGIDAMTKDLEAGPSAIEIGYLKTNIEDKIKTFLYLMPSILLLSFSFLFLINTVLSKRFFAAAVPRIVREPLTTFQVPFAFVWTVIGALAFFLLNNQVFKIDTLEFVSMNLLFAFSLFYFFQGVAIIFHFLDKKKIGGFLRLLIYFILFRLFMDPAYFLQIMTVVVALGFFDSWIDNRKLSSGQPVLKA